MEDGKVESEIDDLIRLYPAIDAQLKAFNDRFKLKLTTRDLEPGAGASLKQTAQTNGSAAGRVDVRKLFITSAKQLLRKELTELEQYVLISIFDQSWKDHLYAMDMLKSGIGLQAFAERDPRIAYKREGFRYFQEMMAGIRDRVTNIIFRARVTGPAPQARSAYQVTAATHEAGVGYGVSENVAATGGAPEGAGEMQAASEQSQGEGTKVKTIVRQAPKVGRNDPCPCGSGKKYKKCCGAAAA
jgi:preprotein translocase subunit SecA